ncbi:MAG: carbonic anhydrase [Pseudomonadota bacterium]
MRSVDAIQRLVDGNQRFVDGRRDPGIGSEARRVEVAEGQTPFAVILGCSDSRAPAEILFDQDLGDLFVVRVAGNVATSTEIGSIEFAVAKFGSGLIVVLGHSQCGAVAATLGARGGGDTGSEHIQCLVDLIAPAIDGIDDIAEAVKANVRHVQQRLLDQSQILRNKVADGSLTIVGAEYSLETGRVEFFEAQ